MLREQNIFVSEIFYSLESEIFWSLLLESEIFYSLESREQNISVELYFVFSFFNVSRPKWKIQIHETKIHSIHHPKNPSNRNKKVRKAYG